MRKKLEAIQCKGRQKFKGVFLRYGSKCNYRKGRTLTVLVADIRDDEGELMCDHMWFDFGDGFENIELRPYDTLEFLATIKKYNKGYRSRDKEHDYRLSKLEGIRKVSADVFSF
ncbi:hypothetical protein CUJ83_11290 [Methanocella sp. CWC-04]|uniref:Uncharacterized protein n=1 Tax=Methanooceanicella nereidis TaxID=2052831 RepID=A0AAP2REA0_9EURY|nr:hypothetical protein [Methanocella sp. CWC-04]MCD1295582.1 hypothetical protein [Methanocella sp. CWC-04]